MKLRNFTLRPLLLEEISAMGCVEKVISQRMNSYEVIRFSAICFLASVVRFRGGVRGGASV